MPKCVFQDTLLHRDLRACVDVLHRTATTGADVQAGVRTPRYHAQRGLVCNLDRAAGLVPRLLAQYFVNDGLARQRTFDEHRLALAMGDAASFLVEGLNHDLESFAAHR